MGTYMHLFFVSGLIVWVVLFLCPSTDGTSSAATTEDDDYYANYALGIVIHKTLILIFQGRRSRETDDELMSSLT